MPVVVGGREVFISASIGLVVEPRAMVDRPQSLLQAADVAMYRAKSKGKGRFEIFDHEMYKEQLDLLDLKGDLAVALERGEFEVFYQPIVDMGDERIVSIEALIRWHHPSRGLVTPDRFISLAEQTGLIVPIGRWVLRESCQQLSRWRTAVPRDGAEHGQCQPVGPPTARSRPRQGRHGGAGRVGPRPVAAHARAHREHDDRRVRAASRILEQLRASRVQIAIDDFGTGFSSLSYLRRLPVDIIKIDRSFVMEMRNSATAEALVRMVIDLAKVLDLRTVAEGIEDGAQAEQLSTLLCDEGQGYFFARPQPAAEIKALFTPQNEPDGDRPLPHADPFGSSTRCCCRRGRSPARRSQRRPRCAARRARGSRQCSPALAAGLGDIGDQLDALGHSRSRTRKRPLERGGAARPTTHRVRPRGRGDGSWSVRDHPLRGT